jgi:3-deoxy-7-phosphoheptulonate synthase
MASSHTTDWHPGSWQQKTALQQPTYPDEQALERAVRRLSQLPPLVTSWEVERLKEKLAEAAYGRRFLLQGGDCAESFDECEGSIIANRLKILLQMSLVLIYGMEKGVIRVGRFAGQYAKPRSSDLQTRNGTTLPSYRGDIINLPDFTESSRTPNPELMLQAYSHSALTINFVRALVDGGFADLHHPEYWNLDFARHAASGPEYAAVVDRIRESLRFMETITNAPLGNVDRVDFYTSHEALLLPYEQALTRQVPRRQGIYNLSTHFPWIGMRTAQLDGAHVEYARGLANPIGIKVGSGMSTSTLVELLRILNPDDEPGRITLITRFGVDKIEADMPPLIEAVQATGKTVVWCSDPMHGNTETTEQGFKTRRFDNILNELELAFDIHAAMGTTLGGVHFELTGENVTECTGGARGLTEADLVHAYKSQVDPRLNAEQALEMAFCIIRKHKRMTS